MTSFTRYLRFFLIATVVVSASFLIAPQSGRAQFVVTDPGLTVEQIQANILQNSVSWMDVVKNTISSIADVSTEINTYALWVKYYVLDPMAFVLSGNALKAITAGVVDFVNGGNGTGSPSFVQNLRRFNLNTGDSQAFAFFAEFSRNSNSPFAGGILSSLRANYLQSTSAAGFWAANRSTLPQYSQNPLAFVGGNFSQGGWSAWFALTSQPQNNPYSQYYRAQAEWSARTYGATKEALDQLSWGQGFLSWCGDAVSDDVPDSVTITGHVGGSSASGAVDADGFPIIDQAALDQQTADTFGTLDINNLDQQILDDYERSNGRCPEGSQVETPGSVIHDGLQKVLGTDLDKLVNVGDANTIFSNLAQTLQIMSYGASLLGSSGSGGLFGASHPRGGTPTSMVDRYRNQQGYLGVTQAGVNAAQGSGPEAKSNPNLLANAASAETKAASSLNRPVYGAEGSVRPPTPTPPPVPLSPDGTMISNGTGSLQTVDGTWTFGAPYSAAVGNWYILLNGELVGGAAGSQLKVDNGGQLYALGTDNNWYVWQEDSWVMFAAALPCDITPPNNALRACFFDGTNAPLTASSALQQRVQTNIPSPVGAWSGFFEDWGNESVAGTGKSDDVSGVWRGSVNFLAGTYVFHTQSDDGVELTIDGTKVIDNWTNHPLTTDDSAPLLLTAGLHTVQLRWYENSGEAAIGLSWDYAP